MALCRREKLFDDEIDMFIELAIHKVIDVNHTNEYYGNTPLISLCLYNQSNSLFDCIEILLQNSTILVNQTNKDGVNALMALCANSRCDKMVDIIELLISKGADVNHVDTKYGRNALMFVLSYTTLGPRYYHSIEETDQEKM